MSGEWWMSGWERCGVGSVEAGGEAFNSQQGDEGVLGGGMLEVGAMK